MSEFHRMVTYLYLYEGDQKTRNVGYSKIEKRDAHCRVEIHMKNTGLMEHDIPVYFYAQNNVGFPGILLGSMHFSRGMGDFKELLNASSIADTGCDISNIKGIFLPVSNEEMILSQWDDDAFDRNSFFPTDSFTSTKDSEYKVVSLEKELSASKELPISEKSSKLKDVSSQKILDTKEISFSQKTSELDTPSLETSEPDTLSLETSELDDASLHSQVSGLENISLSTKTCKSETDIEKKESTDAETETTLHAKTTNVKAAEAAPDFSQETLESSPSHSTNSQIWDFIMHNFPPVSPFPTEDSFKWVQLELKDLRLLPKSYWYLGNNSFLLHGFFNYHHLLLGYKKDIQPCKWSLGVPGVFQNPERVMAAFFGFPEFHSTSEANTKTGQFGYWIRPL